MREAVSDAYASQSMYLRERAQRDDVVVAVIHRIGIVRISYGVLEVGLIENDQHAGRHLAVKLVRIPRE